MDTNYWRNWLGEKPDFYLNTFDGDTPPANETNLRGLAHDAFDEIERLKAALDVAVAAERERFAARCAEYSLRGDSYVADLFRELAANTTLTNRGSG